MSVILKIFGVTLIYWSFTSLKACHHHEHQLPCQWSLCQRLGREVLVLERGWVFSWWHCTHFLHCGFWLILPLNPRYWQQMWGSCVRIVDNARTSWTSHICCRNIPTQRGPSVGFVMVPAGGLSTTTGIEQMKTKTTLAALLLAAVSAKSASKC